MEQFEITAKTSKESNYGPFYEVQIKPGGKAAIFEEASMTFLDQHGLGTYSGDIEVSQNKGRDGRQFTNRKITNLSKSTEAQEQAPAPLTSEGIYTSRSEMLELPKIGVSLEYKMGLPEYSNATVSLFVSGITEAHTDEDIEHLVARGKFVYERMAERIAAMTKEARAKKGWEETP